MGGVTASHRAADESRQFDWIGMPRRHISSGLWLPLFEELADPRAVATVAVEAEKMGWHGLFVWDQMRWREPIERSAQAARAFLDTDGNQLPPLRKAPSAPRRAGVRNRARASRRDHATV